MIKTAIDLIFGGTPQKVQEAYDRIDQAQTDLLKTLENAKANSRLKSMNGKHYINGNGKHKGD